MKALTFILAAMIIATTCISCSTAHQPQTLSERVDNFFAENANKFSGAIEIQQNGKTVYQKALGFADVENKIPVKADTKFRIGSITKTFMSVLVLKAANEQKLSLEDRLAKYFPDAKIPNAEQITVDMLLYHRSGLRDVVNDDYSNFVTYYTKPQTRAQMIERIANAGVNFAPDSTFRYCNTGFILLTYILEDVYGKSYGELLDEQIIKPLQLGNTGVCTSPIDGKDGFARSYSLSGELQDEFDPTAVLGAGALYSTTSDLLKFFNALASGYFGTVVFEQMRQFKDNWGRGMIPGKVGDIEGFGHTGGIHGFSAALFRYGDISIAFCSNNQFSGHNDLICAIMGVPVEKHQYVTLTKEQLAKHEGKYHNDQLKMDIEITSTGDYLIAQASGQSAFPLDAISETKFEFNQAGVKITFADDDKSFTMNQHGGKFEFARIGEIQKTDCLVIAPEQLQKFTGVYHSDALKMDLTVTVDGNQLKGQGSGQPSFPLNPISDNSFEFKPADIVIRFDVENKKLTLRQRGMDFELVKK